MKQEQFEEFTHQLLTNLMADTRVVSLVVLGSTAAKTHVPDEWSDHDFFVITEPNEQDHFRLSYDWLPDHEQIILTIRETDHGLKILYDDGHLLEFAVFDLHELQLARVNDYAVLLDRGTISQAIAEIANRSVPQNDTTSRDLGMFISLLLAGVGRYARGEQISAHAFIKTYALGHLLNLLNRQLPAGDKSALDTLDPFRRFEQVFPTLGREINQVLLLPVVDSSIGLLAIYEENLSSLPDYPHAAVSVVRDFLDRLK